MPHRKAMNMTTDLAPQDNLFKVIENTSRPLAERVDGLRKLMLMNQAKISIGAAGLLNTERMIQVACLSIRKNPELLECTIPSLFGALSEAATYGWVCDGIMGQASLVPFNNTKKKCKEATLIPGYKGLRDLVSRSGKCQTMMESVHVGDRYEFKSMFELPLHERSEKGDRKFQPITHAYVVGMFGGGIIKVFSWSVAECIAHRDRYSQSWRRVAGKKWPDGKSKEDESPWCERNPAFRVMCMKSVMLDAIHRGEFPMSVEDMNVVRRDEQFSAVESSTILPGSAGMLGIDDEQPTDDSTIDGTAAATQPVVEADGGTADDWSDFTTRLAEYTSLRAVRELYDTMFGPDSEIPWSLDQQTEAAKLCDERTAAIKALPSKSTQQQLTPPPETE